MTLLSLTPAGARAAGPDAGAAEVGAPVPDPDAGGGDAPATMAVDAGAPADGAAPSDTGPPLPALAPPTSEAAPLEITPKRIEELTVVGTRESRTAGSAHVLRPRDLERMDYDNPETVTKMVAGVYARGEDGFGLRPNIGIRGVSPDRSKKLTLMEDGVLFAPAPYAAPAAYYFPLITRMELVRVIKGPGAVSFGPNTIGGAIDLVTRSIPAEEAGMIDLATGMYGYGKLHGAFGASTARAGYVIEGVHLRSTGYKQLDGGGDTGFEKNEWMWKGRYLLSSDPQAFQSVGLKLGYSDEDSRESYLGLTDADFRKNPYRRYVSSRLDRMQWHRTQIAATYHAKLRGAFTIDAAAYRNDFHRTWRKFNRIGPNGAVSSILANPTGDNADAYSVLIGEGDTSTLPGTARLQTIYIGPNRREFASQGIQVVGRWQGNSGAVEHRAEAGVRYHHDRIDFLHTEDGFFMENGALVRTDEPTITTADSRNWANALALHLTDAATWGPMTVTPGMRVELIRTWTRDRYNQLEGQGPTQRIFIPGVGVYGALTPSLGLLAGVYRGFSPAAPPKAVNASQGLVFVSAEPEMAVNYEAGVRFMPPRFRLEAIGFFNDYQNLTAICTESSGCTSAQIGMQSDAGRAHIYGAEFFARGDIAIAPGYAIPLIASYTFTRTELLGAVNLQDPTLGDVQPGDELPFVPAHQAAATLAFETPRASLAVAGTYVSAMREHAGQGPATLTEPFTDPSFILDVTARVPVTRAGQLYFNVRNLLGAEDIAARLPYGARPVAPRWVQVGTKWSF
jgi:Fe(3+) dicitrate transport protein